MAFFMSSSSTTVCFLISATRALAASASSFLPSFISMPMLFEMFFTSESRLSSSDCAALRLLSNSRTFSMASRAPAKCFFSKPRITVSLSSVICLIVNMANIFFIAARSRRLPIVDTWQLRCRRFIIIYVAKVHIYFQILLLLRVECILKSDLKHTDSRIRVFRNMKYTHLLTSTSATKYNPNKT